jgi:phosphomannomutase
LIRYSGTEPLLRVMLEGQNTDDIETMGQAIVTAVRGAGL